MKRGESVCIKMEQAQEEEAKQRSFILERLPSRSSAWWCVLESFCRPTERPSTQVLCLVSLRRVALR
jgi:hypothetical protein